jgi:hypothetical protein
LSTKSLFLASVAYLLAGILAGGLLANGAAAPDKPQNLREAARSILMPTSNSEAKQDRLTASYQVASIAPELTGSLPPAPAVKASRGAEKIGSPVPSVSPPVVSQPVAPAKPKAVAKRPGTNSFLSDEQIAGVKERMKLTPFQEQHWPAIEVALRKIATKLQRSNKSGADTTPVSIDPNSPEVQDLKTAAMPLLFTLSEDQKREVRTLARVIGLEAVASAI